MSKAMIKAMILAAGRGERMRPLTDSCPKPLLKVKDKSLIEYHLNALAQAGIKDVVINHAWLGEQIEEALGDGKSYGLNIVYSKENEALETAGGIVQALPLLTNPSGEFLLLNGDVFTDYPIANLLDIKLTAQAHLVMVDNPGHNHRGDFILDNGYLFEKTDSKNKAKNASSSNSNKKALTYSGIGRYSINLFSNLTPGKRALAPILKEAMAHKGVLGEHYQGQWTDVGTPERLSILNCS